MKKHLNYLLMAALVGGLSLGVVSCKDDDNASLSPEEEAATQQAELSEKATKFWNVVGQLVGTIEATDDYASRTYEATIGTAVSGNETTRRLLTNDMETAADRFCNLAGLAEGTVTTETASYTWSDPDVGTLTYTKTDNDASLATVDVDIRQVPGLRQIVYLTPEQAGDNAGDYHNCYYRFGDVISRKNSSGIDELWICVRPSFEPEKKGESHWVTLSPLPKENILEYTSSNKNTYRLPKNLGVNYEHTQNLAEMVYAMASPNDWGTNITNNPRTSIFNKGVPMFHDFDKSKITYTSTSFWERVATGWERSMVNTSEGEKSLWYAIFGISRTAMFTDIVSNKGALRFIHSSANWNTWTSNSPTIYEVVYRNGSKAKSNMHEETRTSYSTRVVYKGSPSQDIKLDFVESITTGHPYIVSNDYFKDMDRHYVIRHATGTELAKATNSAYSPKTALTGYTEVYNYNKRYDRKVEDKCETYEDITRQENKPIDEPKLGCVIGADGKFYEAPAHAKLAGTEAVALVVYLGAKGTADASSNDYRGLAVAMTTFKNEQFRDQGPKNSDDICLTEQIDEVKEAANVLAGIQSTKDLIDGCGRGHTHPAALKCKDFNAIDAATRRACNMSDWFIPTLGQWIMVIESLTAKKQGSYWTTDWETYMTFNDMDFSFANGYYWTTTQKNDDMGFYNFTMHVQDPTRTYVEEIVKNSKAHVRPFIAF